MRIRADGGRTGREQPLDVLPHERRTVTSIEHVRFTDVLIDAARSRR